VAVEAQDVEHAELGAGVAAAPGPRRRRRTWTRFILPTYTALVLLYLVLPIGIMILYSFNDGSFKDVSFRWLGFTAKWYGLHELTTFPDLIGALANSLVIAAVSTAIAVALGTPIALALVRYRFRGREPTEFMLFLNIAAPEIVLGAALLSLFVMLNIARGMVTIIIAHVMFNIAFVAITVRARLTGFERDIEEAAQDLGASPWVTFWTVTLPLIFPGIVAGALLAFALSIDDFIITNFTAGGTLTFPLWIWGASRIGIPPEVFVLGTLIFAGGVLLALVNVAWQRRAWATARLDRATETTEDASLAA
jgi:spermidine/putrescine transport system permease protein